MRVDAEKFAAGLLRSDLQFRSGDYCQRAGLALHAERLDPSRVEQILLRLLFHAPRLFPRHREQIIADDFILQLDAPLFAVLVAAPNVGAGDLDVPEGRGNLQPELLHRRILDFVTHQRPSADERLVQREPVCHFRAHPRLDGFGCHDQFPQR